MTMTAKTRKPGAGGRRVSEHVAGLRALYGKDDSSRLPANWRDRLLDPTGEYSQYFALFCLPNGFPLGLAALAVEAARVHMRAYADATDAPAWEAVEAADLLDAVADLLADTGGKDMAP